MTKISTIITSALSLVALGAAPAFAGGSEGAIGLGAEFQLSGLGGMSGSYDMGQFHVGGFLGFDDDTGMNDSRIELGGRFYYHLHSTAMSDFGIGGSLGMSFEGDVTEVFIEPGFQTRAFIASNVALSFTGGLSLGIADADGVLLSGQPNFAAGVHYYFF